MTELEKVVLGLIDAIDRADAHYHAPKTGVQVPFQGDFCDINPSTLRDLVWWARRMKVALLHDAMLDGCNTSSTEPEP